MTPLEFAHKYFPNFKTRGSEIIPVYCPYCHGGRDGHDKYTFALNMDNLTFNCKRGSCGVSGTFKKLCEDHGEEVTRLRNFELIQRQKIYKAPQTKVKEPSSAVEKYLSLRGFSSATWKRRGVGEDGKGNIIFPYYENGQLVMVKFRPARKVKKGERKAWREEGGKPVFWGMDLCKPDLPLVIVEGEFDALALDECGIANAVSVPSGAEDLTCVDLCWDWLQQFKKIVLWVDNDPPGQELQRKLINRLGAWRCWVVQSNRKDANEVLYFDGKDAIVRAFNSAVEVPMSGLIRLADVKAFDYSKATRVKSGFRGLDKAIGGFLMGEFTVWTGVNGHGKSTVLGQIMLEAVDQGYSVCAYSGELPAPVYRYWIDLQAAGPRNLEKRYDAIKEVEITYPKLEVTKAIRSWYRDKFFLYDSYGTATDDTLFEVFEYAAQRYDCRVFLIDNLMTIDLSANDSNYYRQQSEFINKIASFSQQYQVHVHLVAHPRKVQGRLTKMDISGSGDIANRANNVLSVYRLTENEKNERKCDALLETFKNRFYGVQDAEIELNFEQSCRRFYMASEAGPFKKYGWENEQLEDLDVVYDDSEIPF